MKEKIEVDMFEYRGKPLNRVNLKKLREIYGATQDELAEAIHVSRVSISNWENGIGGQISKTSLEKLCNLYGVEVGYFFDLELDDDIIDTILENKNNELMANAKEKAGRARPRKKVEIAPPPTKDDAFQTLLKRYTFQEAMTNYLNALKLIIGLSITCTEEEAELALKIEEQMGRKLRAALKERQEDIRGGNKIEVLYSQLDNCRETKLF